MNINDQRHKKQELSFDELEAGEVYVSSRHQRYLMKMRGEPTTVCMETGNAFDISEHEGDEFTPVKATLLIG